DATDGDAERAQDTAQARLDAMERRLAGPIPRLRQSRNAARTAMADASSAVGASGGRPPGLGGRSPLESRTAYEGAVGRIQDYIRAGDCFQVVPSRRLARPTRASPFAIYRALRSINPSPYMFYLALGDFAVAGASPELLVRIEDGTVAVHPIAGTR